MNKQKLTSNTAKKIILISIIFVMMLGISVFAGTAKLNNVKIKFATNYEITVMTSKTKVEDILKENHIILEENEVVSPALGENIDENGLIIISLEGNEPVKKAEVETIVATEDIVKEYSNITEKIVVVLEDIPFETITKDVSNGSLSTTNKVLQYGRNGQRKVSYKITYKDDIEVAREELSSEIIREPVNKIVQIQTKQITSRSSNSYLIPFFFLPHG